jgi:uncharacterized protein YwgA
MRSFEGRLKLQKIVYLMEGAFDLNIGYGFSWYVRGPYSTEVANDGFAMRGLYASIPPAKFVDPEAEKRFSDFQTFLGDKKDDADWLEIVASIHFLRKVHPRMTKQEIIQRVKNKQWYFTKVQCEAAWSYLERWGKI